MYEQLTIFDVDEPNKRCIRCGEYKSIPEFVTNRNTCKACHGKRCREWKARNPERKRAINRLWYERNKDAVNEQARQWVENNPEKRRAVARKYNRKRQQQDPEGRAAYRRDWNERNPGKNAKYTQTYRAAKLQAPGDGATLDELISIHGPFCYICSTAAATEVEHVIPLSKGGTNYLENLRPACRSCNARKRNRVESEGK